MSIQAYINSKKENINNISKIGLNQQSFKAWILPKGSNGNLELINTNAI